MTRLTLTLSIVFLIGLFALSGSATRAYGFDSSDAPYRTVSWHSYWVDDDAPMVRERIITERDFDQGPVVREERRIVREHDFDTGPVVREERRIIRDETPVVREYVEPPVVYRPGLSIGVPFFSFHLG